MADQAFGSSAKAYPQSTAAYLADQVHQLGEVRVAPQTDNAEADRQLEQFRKNLPSDMEEERLAPDTPLETIRLKLKRGPLCC